MNGNSKELVGVLKNSTPINSIYKGNRLVWGGDKEPINPYEGLIAGRFLLNTPSTYMYYYKDGEYKTANKVNIYSFADYANRLFLLNIELKGNTSYMWFENEYLVEICNLPITDKVTSMKLFFYACRNLESIHCDNWDLSNVLYMDNCFGYCSKLTTITGSISNIRPNLNLQHSPLTNDSAMVIINGLKDYAGTDSTRTLTLKSITYNTLTEEQKAIATNKGWTIKSA